jgi:moderate conductance mechanosensitive channel
VIGFHAVLRQLAGDARPLIDWRTLFNFELLLLRLFQIALILLLAVIAFRAVRALIRSVLGRQVDEVDPILKREREQKMQTLSSLLGNVAGVVIFLVAVLTALGTFLDIGPLLASVGVFGLAISFGAQSLVKDVISGTFLLIEGQFGVGDIVRIGDVSGLVEKITIRTTVLRDGHGIVHIIPNGSITRVSNMTKNWSRAVLDIGVAYKEDVDRVMEVMRDVGRELRADPEWAPLLLDECEVLGIDSFADSAVIIRMNAKTLPLKQFPVARELRRRLKNRFDAENIEIPFPHVSFYWGDGQAPAGSRFPADPIAITDGHGPADAAAAVPTGDSGRHDN